MLSDDIDLLLVDPLPGAAVQQALAETQARGVPTIVTSTATIAAPCLSRIYAADGQRGTESANWMVHAVTSGRVVVVYSAQAAGDVNVWLSAVQRRLAEQPSITVDLAACPWSVSGAQQRVGAMARDGTMNGIIALDGVLARGAVLALTENGLPVPPVAGGDDWNGWLRTAREFGMPFLGFGAGTNMGLTCVELAMQVLSGKAVAACSELPLRVFDHTSTGPVYQADLSDHYYAFNELPAAWVDRMFRTSAPRAGSAPNRIA